MTKKEFDECRDTLTCQGCHIAGHIHAQEAAFPHEWEIRCQNCGRHIRFLKKEKNKDKRPTLKPGTIDRVWEEYGNRCACCGITAKNIIEVLGIGRTVQHAPPYKYVKNEGKLIPFCTWCQNFSASRMKELEAHIKRVKALRNKDDQKYVLVNRDFVKAVIYSMVNGKEAGQRRMGELAEAYPEHAAAFLMAGRQINPEEVKIGK